MADYSIPLQIQQPQMFGAMGNLLNTAQGIQALQTGQIQQQRLGINLQSEAQANQERRNVIQAMQSQDPDLAAGPDGIIDTQRATAKLQQLAPQTYNQYLQSINTTNQGAVKTNADLRSLGQDTLSDLGKVAKSVMGQSIAAKADAFDTWADQIGTPQAKKAANSLITSLKTAKSKQDGGDDGDDMVFRASNRANTVAEQMAAAAPAYEQIGANVVQTKPGIPGTPQTLLTAKNGVIPATIAPGYMVDSSGNLVKVGGVGGGPVAPAAPKPATAGILPAAPAWMNKQQAQNASDAQARWSFAQNRDVDTNAGYNPTAQVYKNLTELLAQNPNLGPGSAQANQFIGRISTLTKQAIPDLNTAYQVAASYLDRLGSQNAMATGAANKFQDEQAARAVGSPEAMGPPAIQEKLRFGASINEAAHAYARASQAFITKQGPNAAYANPQLFEWAWSDNASPIAFRLMADLKNGDKADFDATAARASAKDYQSYLNLRDYLLKGLLPPNSSGR